MTAMLEILAVWAGASCVLVGWGLLLQWVLGIGRIDSRQLLVSFWVGLALLVGVLQVYHIFGAINGWAVSGVAAIGAIGVFAHARRLFGWISSAIRKKPLLTALLSLVAIWASNLSLRPCGAHDTGTYHLAAIRWMNAYPIVPGLGNLHGRLGFNNAHLLYGAALEELLGSGRSIHVATPLLLLALLYQGVLALLRVAAPASSEPADWFDTIMVVPGIVYLTGGMSVSFMGFQILIAVFLVAESMVVECIRLPCVEVNDRRVTHRIVSATLLCCLGCCIKLNAVVWCMCSLVFLAGLACRRAHRLTPIPWILAIALAYLGPWAVRGYYLTGYLVYPSALVECSPDWKVPREQVLAEAAWTRQMARVFHSQTTRLYPAWTWLSPWFKQLTGRHGMPILLPLGISAVAYGGWVLGHCRWRTLRGAPRWSWILEGLAAVAVVSWFLAYPQPRFGGPVLWVLAGLSLWRLGCALLEPPCPRTKCVVLGAILAIAALALASRVGQLQAYSFAKGKARWHVGILVCRPAPVSGFYPLPTAATKRYVTSSGLVLDVPVEPSNAMWYAPLLSTPHPSPGLRLRNPASVREGFWVAGDWRPENWPNPQTPFLRLWRETR